MKFRNIVILGLLSLSLFAFVPEKKEKIEFKAIVNLNNLPKPSFHDTTFINHIKKAKKEIVAQKWVDSVYNQMSLLEKIGQLFMVAAYSNKDSIHENSVNDLVVSQHIGGLIFFQGGPIRQAKLTNRFQKSAKLPLLIGIDAEWGLSMRLDSTFRYPWNMTLGAVQDLGLIEQMGIQMGQQSKRMGIHFTFAPVVDINTNPKNPIIGTRSYGEDKFNVSNHALAYMKGIQSTGVFATAKHFPGHGDTENDSHYTLPTVSFSKERIQDVELFPYKNLINNGLASIMVAHLNVPALEAQNNVPSSISASIVTDLLKKDLHFNGLIFTDALNMKAASNFKAAGEIDLAAFLAGNDVLLFSENVASGIQKITEAYENQEVSEERLAYSVKKILQYKFKAGLHKRKAIQLNHLFEDLNQEEFENLNTQLFQSAQTVLKNKKDFLPISDFKKEKIAYIKMGDDVNDTFLEYLNYFTEVTEVEDASLDRLIQKLKPFTKVIIGYHKADGAWKKHDLKDKELVWLYEIAREKDIVFASFAKPYSLMDFDTFENFEAILLSYQNHPLSQMAAAQVIFGSLEAQGKIPVTINEAMTVGLGLNTKPINRLGFANPISVGMNPNVLSKIDSVANYAIAHKLTPGMQILVARKGKVIYQKSFGHQTYDSISPSVNNQQLYDVASLTKIISTLPLAMQLYDAKHFNFQTTLGQMLPEFKNSDKKNITFKELLSHYARLQAWEPFYKSTLDSLNKPSSKYYQSYFSDQYSNQVAETLYISKTYEDSIIQKIVKSKLLPKKEYKYSDFTFIILKRYIEKITGKSLDVLAEKNLYVSLGANSTLYNPLKKFDMSQMAPTEDDNYYRYQTIQGYVHDMTAAMQGGVGGHAGIFSNSMDVAKIMQLFLQKGNYGGIQYFSEKAFNDFNTCYFCEKGNRRGIGFDKPQLEKSGPTCGCASMTSFGHTGFTGTMAWADPEHELVYVFLSNRTFPSSAVNNLSKENIRENIQQIIYDAILE
uniref:glycoside hydrolase family 3 N-terminal domain-containing protein n=1 Tax=Flavobacterium sp. TaxID=239 RepID=UPI004049DC16